MSSNNEIHNLMTATVPMIGNKETLKIKIIIIIIIKKSNNNNSKLITEFLLTLSVQYQADK